MRVLLVEDDPIICQSLKQTLEDHQLQCQVVTDFDQVMTDFQQYQPDLVLLDLHLPTYNGYYWCSQIRKISKVPILFISAATESMDQLMAMELGADDYITKPLDLDLTMAKIKAWLRRVYGDQPNDVKLIFGDIVLDIEKSSLYKRNNPDQTIDLSYTELQIMTCLFKGQGNYVAREKILDYCWQNQEYIDDNTLAVNISRLRKKLRTIQLDDLIETKVKVGYRLNEAN